MEQIIGYHYGLFRFDCIIRVLRYYRAVSFSREHSRLHHAVLGVVTIRLYYRVSVGGPILKMLYQKSHLRSRTSIS